MKKMNWKVEMKDYGKRIDHYLAVTNSEITRSFWQKLIEMGNVLVDGKRVKSGYKLKGSEQIEATFPDPIEMQIQPVAMDLCVIYEDKDILVVNKKAGVVVHPAEHGRHWNDSMVSGLLEYVGEELTGIGGVKRPGLVHRLDKDTSGLMIVAKTEKAYQVLVEDFKQRRIKKEYLALVTGKFVQKEALIDMPIGRDMQDRKKMSVNSINAKNARTRFKVMKTYQLPARAGYLSLIEVDLLTGRTHQIRVHLKAISHALAGDKLYGHKKLNDFLLMKYGLDRQFLHAWKLTFNHPITQKQLCLVAEPPVDLMNCLEQLAELES